jgi:hypothetical protein
MHRSIGRKKEILMSGSPPMPSARKKAILALGLSITLAACGPRQPDICRAFPPEDDSRYSSWLLEKQKAGCSRDTPADKRIAMDQLRSPGAEDDIRIEASLPTITARAQAGDREALGDLIDYYARKQSLKQTMFWMEKLGDLGDENDRESLLNLLQGSTDPKAPDELRRLRRKWSQPKSEHAHQTLRQTDKPAP